MTIVTRRGFVASAAAAAFVGAACAAPELLPGKGGAVALAEGDALLRQHDLPTAVRLDHPDQAMAALLHDKKNLGGKLNVVLLDRIGQARIYPTLPDFFKGVESWIG